MQPKVILFGATGYTGRLVAKELVNRGGRPVLCGRSPQKLQALSADLGGLEIAPADADDASRLAALLGKGDILISTVGPFVKYGHAAVTAAADRGALYIDSTGEPAFIQSVFEHYGPKAQATGALLMTACGYDYIPGNCAAGIALEASGNQAARVDIGYYSKKNGRVGPLEASQGTQASLRMALVAPVSVWRSGRRVTETGGIRMRRFSIDGEEHPALSVSGTEHFSLPRIHPDLKEINTYLGWFGGQTRVMRNAAVMQSVFLRIPGYRSIAEWFLSLLPTSKEEGPDAERRQMQTSHIVAETYTNRGDRIARTDLVGVDGYTFTARFMAWAADRLSTQRVSITGAAGPIEVFGLQDLQRGCEAAGLSVLTATGR